MFVEISGFRLNADWQSCQCRDRFKVLKVLWHSRTQKLVVRTGLLPVRISDLGNILAQIKAISD